MRPESLHFSKFSVDAETADCRTSLLSCLHWGHQAIKRILEKKKKDIDKVWLLDTFFY